MAESKLTIGERQVGDVTVLTLTGQILLDDGDLALRKQIHGLVERGFVKVVLDRAGFALYFSRAPIPYARDPKGGWPPLYRHVGIYAYRRQALMVLASLEPTPLERTEALEQLRALEHGIRIKVVETAYDSIGVDTPADLEQVRRLLAETTAH